MLTEKKKIVYTLEIACAYVKITLSLIRVMSSMYQQRIIEIKPWWIQFLKHHSCFIWFTTRSVAVEDKKLMINYSVFGGEFSTKFILLSMISNHIWQQNDVIKKVFDAIRRSQYTSSVIIGFTRKIYIYHEFSSILTKWWTPPYIFLYSILRHGFCYSGWIWKWTFCSWAIEVVGWG